MLTELPAVMPRLLDAYRSGGGVPGSELGTSSIEEQALMNRPLYLRL